MDFSLIVPCHNEADNVALLYQTTRETLDPTGLTYELIFIDDGSTDRTLEVLKGLAAASDADAADRAVQPALTIVSFSRNFGKEAALYAGLQRAEGDYVGLIDADLQQDPATALEMLQFLQANPDYDCVAAVQEGRKEGAILKAFKSAFYWVFNKLDSIDIPANASDFRVFKRSVAEALLQLPENFRFSKGLFSWVGFRTHTMTYRPAARHAGKTNWSFRGLMNYALSGIISFSTRPLRLATWFGTFTAVAAALYLLVVLYETFFVHNAMSGYPTLVCLVLLFGGIQMMILGIMGEYLGRVYIEGKRRPIYLTREEIRTR